jgi:cysteine-rich repeat protein
METRRLTLATAILVCGVLLVGAGTASADVKASRRCRATIGKEFGRAVAKGLGSVDACHKAQQKAGEPGGLCNVLGSDLFDSRGRYAAAKDRAEAKIEQRCLTGDAVLENYTGGEVADAVLPILDGTIAGNSVLVQGNTNVSGDTRRTKCLRAVSRERTKQVKAIVAKAVTCQRRNDKNADTFGPIDDSCLAAATASPTAAAVKKLNRACGGLVGLGTCGPLPGCVVDGATDAGKRLARSIYAVAGPTAVCGNGTEEDGEQCDDANTTAGDGCSDACELEGMTCTGAVGERVVRVSIDTPEPLAAVRVDLEYPQFQAGVSGTGASTIVGGQVDVLQGTPADVLSTSNDLDTDLTVVLASASAFMNTGALFDVTMDECVALDRNICNRNQNVIECCQEPGQCADPNAPPACTIFPLDSVGAGAPAGCCPADNSCTSQTDATACSVSGPVNASGEPVEGVTCTVSIGGV